MISNIGDLNQMNSGVYCVPACLSDEGLGINGDRMQRRPNCGAPNLSGTARSYLERLGANVMDWV